MELPLSKLGRRYGYLKDTPDHRDFGVAHVHFGRSAGIIQSNNSLYMGPVLDQGQQGSCTAHAGAADREFLHWKQLGKVVPAPEGLFSPSFLYYIERQLDGSLSEGDTGSYGRTSCQALAKYGCALRSEMPYKDTDWTTAPTAEQLKAALSYPSGGYHRLATVDDMKSVIVSGYNFRIGFTVYESFESHWSVPGYMPLPKSGERVLGGHEVLAIGYDDNMAAFLIRNSWGKAWGLSGNFWMPYNAAANSNILSDAWIQHLGIWR